MNPPSFTEYPTRYASMYSEKKWTLAMTLRADLTSASADEQGPFFAFSRSTCRQAYRVGPQQKKN
jgi:hypothetical protein